MRTNEIDIVKLKIKLSNSFNENEIETILEALNESMTKEDIDKKLKLVLLEWRDYYYNQTREDTDKDDTDILDHLENSYNEVTEEQVFDRVRDTLLDTFGS